MATGRKDVREERRGEREKYHFSFLFHSFALEGAGQERRDEFCAYVSVMILRVRGFQRKGGREGKGKKEARSIPHHRKRGKRREESSLRS